MRIFLSSFLTRWDQRSASLLRLTPDRLSPWSIVPLLLGIALFASGCGSGGSEPDADAAVPTDPAIRVETYQVRPQSFEDVIQLTGTVEAIHDATLSAQVSGTIIYIAERGEYVQEGETVAQVDSVEAHAAMVQARANYELAKDRFNRQQPLYRDSIISALEFQQVRSELVQAKSSYAQAKKRLANTSVDAPFSGMVEERMVEAGEQISPGQEVARVVNVRPARVVAGVPDRYVGEIEKGSPVQVRFQATGVGTRTGKVTFVGSTIGPDSRTFPIEITLPNRDQTLKPEMVAQLRLQRSTLDSALVIPRGAVLRDEGGTDVYTVRRISDSLGVAENRPITLGPAYGARAVVSSGIDANAEVVISGQNNIAEGDTVNVVQQYAKIPDSGSPSPPSGTQANVSSQGDTLATP